MSEQPTYDVFLDGEKIGTVAIRPDLAVGDTISIAGVAGSPDAGHFTVTEIDPSSQRLAVVVPSKDDKFLRTS